MKLPHFGQIIVAEQRDDLRRSSETCNPLVEVNNIIEVVDDCDSE